MLHVPRNPQLQRFASRMKSEHIFGPIHCLPFSAHEILPHHSLLACEIRAQVVLLDLGAGGGQIR